MPSLPLWLRCCLLPLGRGDSGAVSVGRAGRLRGGRGRSRAASVALVVLLVLGQRPSLAAPASAEPAEDFGRWERPVNICLLSLTAAALPLASVEAAAPSAAAAAAAAGAGPSPGRSEPPAATAAGAMAAAGAASGSAAAAAAAPKAAPAQGAKPGRSKPPPTTAGGTASAAAPAASPANRAGGGASRQGVGSRPLVQPQSGPGAVSPGPARSLAAVSAPTPASPQASSPAAAPAKPRLARSRASSAAGALDLLVERSQALAELELPCRSVRLDQQLAGLLTIRFLPSLRGASLPATQLAYTGVLTPGSQPLGCRAGRCDLQGDLELQVSAVAVSALDRQGLPTGLPQAFLARGSCSVAERRVVCQARASLEQSWTAQARW